MSIENQRVRGFQAHIEFRTPGRFYKLYFWRPIVDYTRERYEILKMPEILEVTGSYDWPSDCGVAIGKGEIQSLMDQMWRAGIRPTEGHGSTGQIAAVEKHLEAVSKTQDRLLTMIEKKWSEEK